MWWWNLCKKIKIKIYLYPHGLDGEHLKGIEKKWLPWHHICWIWTIGIVSIQSSSDVFWSIFPASLLKLYLHLTQKHQRASTVIRDVWDAGTLSTESGATFHCVIQLHHWTMKQPWMKWTFHASQFSLGENSFGVPKHVCCTLAGAVVKETPAGFHRNLLNLPFTGQRVKTSAAWRC